MTKKTIQLKDSEEFKDYIQVTEDFYLKPVETYKTSYDVYQLKKSDSPKYPNGKMDDVAYSCSLPRALQLIAHTKAGQGSTDILGLIENIKSFEESFLENVIKIVKESK